jgi:hypothetical protein
VNELFPSDIHSFCVGIKLSMARCVETINVLVYPFLIGNLNPYGTFFFYAGTSLVVMLWELFTIFNILISALPRLKRNYHPQLQIRLILIYLRNLTFCIYYKIPIDEEKLVNYLNLFKILPTA